MRLSAWIASICIMGLAAGCSGNYQSIYRHKPLTNSESSITTIDAKQRAIIAATRGDDGLKFCAEPSPDVFSVVAQAISAGGTFGQRADPKAIEAALTAAFSSSEQGSTIPRTQTINMLRELMYRTCERWLNNELGNAEMPIQAARDQRLMVSILAIEQLTGAVAPKPVVIGAAANASAGASGADAAVRIDDAYKALTAKTAAQQARQKDFDGLNTGTNACDALAKQVEAKETALTPEQEQANGKCNEAKSALAQAKLERAAAAAHHQSLVDAARAGGIPASTESSADSRVAGGGVDRAHTSDVKEVAWVVQSIVDQNFQQDEFLLFCLKVLSPPGSNTEKAEFKAAFSSAQDTCEKHVATAIERETAQQKLEAAQLDAAATVMRQRVDGLFESFWERIKKTDDEADRDKLVAALTDPQVSSAARICMQASTARTSIKKCFDDEVGGGAQRILAGQGRN